MHPDYLDYAIKQRLLPRAEWHDIKFLMRKLTDLPLHHIYVFKLDHNAWQGWVVQFKTEIDLDKVRNNVWGICRLGNKVIFIGVDNV